MSDLATFRGTAYRGDILHFIDDPAQSGVENSYEYLEDGLLLVEGGRVKHLGLYDEIHAVLPKDVEIVQHQNGLIVPGLIDTHIHYPQMEMIASYGDQLLEWLEHHTFPVESKFNSKEYAAEIAELFIDQLLSHGTTTALVFGTVHPESVDAFFETALAKNLRMICGKVMMDRNAPSQLLDTPDSSYEQSKKLIEKWHGQGRLQYAVTPRFAPTSSPEQLQKASDLLREYPSVYFHTHLAENHDELRWVESLFPEAGNYLDVYDQQQLLGRRSIFAHGVHLCDQECQRLGQSQSAIAFCPSSNLFLGSGLFNLEQAENFSVNLGLGSDVGAGTRFSLLNAMGEAYKTQQLRGGRLCPFKSFYLATLGGARALDLEGVIGNFKIGNEADFIFLDYGATPISELRHSRCQSLRDHLFVLSILGDDRSIAATYVLGQKVK